PTASRLVAPVPRALAGSASGSLTALPRPDSAGSAQPWSSRPASALRSLQRCALSWPNSGAPPARAGSAASGAPRCGSGYLCQDPGRLLGSSPGRERRSRRLLQEGPQDREDELAGGGDVVDPAGQ